MLEMLSDPQVLDGTGPDHPSLGSAVELFLLAAN